AGRAARRPRRGARGEEGPAHAHRGRGPGARDRGGEGGGPGRDPRRGARHARAARDRRGRAQAALRAHRRVAARGARARPRAGARGAPPPHRRPDPGRAGVDRHPPGLGPRADPDPGRQLDREQARGLLRQTGFLEFKLVRDRAETEELLRAKYPDGLPPDTTIVFEREKGLPGQKPEERRILAAYLVGTTPDLTGDFLTDARSSLDNRYGWVVNFAFNSEGARRFAKLTGENRGKQLAILLDGMVYSAPMLNERIGGGRGFIHGRFSSQD